VGRREDQRRREWSGAKQTAALPTIVRLASLTQHFGSDDALDERKDPLKLNQRLLCCIKKK